MITKEIGIDCKKKKNSYNDKQKGLFLHIIFSFTNTFLQCRTLSIKVFSNKASLLTTANKVAEAVYEYYKFTFFTSCWYWYYEPTYFHYVQTHGSSLSLSKCSTTVCANCSSNTLIINSFDLSTQTRQQCTGYRMTAILATYLQHFNIAQHSEHHSHP